MSDFFRWTTATWKKMTTVTLIGFVPVTIVILGYVIRYKRRKKQKEMRQILLEKYDVGPHGFGHQMSPCRFYAFEELASQLPDLVQKGKLRDIVEHKLSHQCSDFVIDWETLPYRELQRLHAVCCLITNAYMWGNPDMPIPKYLPTVIATPLYLSSKMLGFEFPVITHSVCDLWNVSHVSRNPDELQLMTPMTKLPDERWFHVVAAAIQTTAGSLMIPGYEVVSNYTDEKALLFLKEVEEQVMECTRILKRMYEHCRPATFFNVYRHYLAGWSSTDKMKELHFEGVDLKCKGGGATAAQAVFMPVLDAILGISHTGDSKTSAFLQDIRLYMPKKHKEFLLLVEKFPSIREQCTITSKGARAQSDEVKQLLDRCIDAVTQFRKCHFRIAKVYITDQISGKKASGTGGSPVETFLQQMQIDTQKV